MASSAETKDRNVSWFVCLKIIRPPSSGSYSDGDDDSDLKMLELSEALSAMNAYRHYFSAKKL